MKRTTFTALVFALTTAGGFGCLASSGGVESAERGEANQPEDEEAPVESPDVDESPFDAEPLPEGETSRLDPAPPETRVVVEFEDLGETFVATVAIVDAVRGQRAWEVVREASELNDPPPEDREYLLVAVHFELLSTPGPEYSYVLSPLEFDLISAEGHDYQQWVPVAGLEPDIRRGLYETASHTGVVPFLVVEDDEPVVAFGRDWRGRGGTWLEIP